MTLIGMILLSSYPSLMYCFKMCNYIWLTLANGEATLAEGRAKSLRTQAITTSEIEAKLNQYLEEAGIETSSLETFMTRLKIIDPDETRRAEEGEDFVELGAVTQRIAQKLYEDRVEAAARTALREADEEED